MGKWLKGDFNKIRGDLVIVPKGNPALVIETDPRPEFNSAEQDFKNINIA